MKKLGIGWIFSHNAGIFPKNNIVKGSHLATDENEAFSQAVC